MNSSRLAWLGVLLLFCAPVRAQETVTVGGAVVPVAQGWKLTEKDDMVVLTPGDLPAGVALTFTLLGGARWEGSLKEAFSAEWKGLETLGKMVSPTNDAVI